MGLIRLWYDSDLLAFTNATPARNRIFSVRLSGAAGNPTGVGSRVSVLLADGSRQCDEVRAGGGYLSHSTPALFYGLGPTGQVREVQVRWPDGVATSRTNFGSGLSVTVRRP